MRLTVMMLALAATAGCATTPREPGDNLVVPGKRIGDVELGMPLPELLRVKGAPIRTVPIEETGATTYQFNGLTVTAHDKVYWIVATDPKFRTVGGAGPGREQIEARSEFGRPECVYAKNGVTTYDYKSFSFDVDNATGKLTQLAVREGVNLCRERERERERREE